MSKKCKFRLYLKLSRLRKYLFLVKLKQFINVCLKKDLILYWHAFENHYLFLKFLFRFNNYEIVLFWTNFVQYNFITKNKRCIMYYSPYTCYSFTSLPFLIFPNNPSNIFLQLSVIGWLRYAYNLQKIK